MTVIGYILWTAGIAAALGLNVLLVWWLRSLGYDNRFLTVLAVAVGFLSCCAWFGAFAWAAQQGDAPAKGTFEVKGGLGPATVCWYEVRTTDTPTVVPVGKTVVVTQHSESHTYTVCAATRADIPASVRGS